MESRRGPQLSLRHDDDDDTHAHNFPENGWKLSSVKAICLSHDQLAKLVQHFNGVFQRWKFMRSSV